MRTVYFLVILLLSSSANAWWYPTENIRVTCTADSEIFPEYGDVYISGTTVTITKNGEKQTYAARKFQTSENVVWEAPQMNIYVALRGNRWWNYHVGTLIVPGPQGAIPMSCNPVP